MTRKEKQFYLADQQKRKDNPTDYPWFAYFQFGWHRMTYLTDEEKDGAVKFYHLTEINNKWVRFGSQPITIMPRTKEREDKTND